jgi:hypothetical protein
MSNRKPHEHFYWMDLDVLKKYSFRFFFLNLTFVIIKLNYQIKNGGIRRKKQNYRQLLYMYSAHRLLTEEAKLSDRRIDMN